MRIRRFVVPAAAALVLGAGGLVAATPVSATPGQPGDCDAYTYFAAGQGYATITCYAPSAYYIPHVDCRTLASPLTTYTITGAQVAKNATATLYCHTNSLAIAAGGVQV